MKEILYLDVFFVTNLLMDLVSLSVGALILSEKIRFSRLFAASLCGAVLSVPILIFSSGNALDLVFGAASFFLTVLVAFGKRKRRFWKACLFSFVTAIFLGGAAQALSYYILSRGDRGGWSAAVFLASGFFALGGFSLWGKSLERKLRTAVVSLAITFSGRSAYFFGLVDSGLLLRENGRPVLLLKAAYATPLLSEEFLEKIRSGELSEGENVFSIPTRTASGAGVLRAFLPERVSILRGGKKKNKEHKDVLVAIDFTEGGFGGCPCLVPLSVI